MIDELGTGWTGSPSTSSRQWAGRSSAAVRPRTSTTDRAEIEHAARVGDSSRVLLFSHRSYLTARSCRVAMQENRLRRCTPLRASICRSGSWAADRRSGVIFIRRKLDDPLYK